MRRCLGSFTGKPEDGFARVPGQAKAQRVQTLKLRLDGLQ